MGGKIDMVAHNATINFGKMHLVAHNETINFGKMHLVAHNETNNFTKGMKMVNPFGLPQIWLNDKYLSIWIP